MKYAWTLALALAFSMPMTAQQNQSAPATPPAGDQQLQSQPVNPPNPEAQAADQATQARQPLQAERREGFWGKINPFARKKYVKRQLDPIRGRVNELDELTAANSKTIRDVDARAQEGLRMASAKAVEADTHAIEAGNRAQQAHQTAVLASSRLQTVEQAVGKIDQYQPVTEADIRFRPGQTALGSKAKQALDEMARSVKGQKGYIIEVQGFSSGKGQPALEGSQRMAQAVVRYLVLSDEIPVYRIYTLGMGNAPLPLTAEGKRPRRTRGGRVEVSLLKNSLADLSAEPISAPGEAPVASPLAPAGTGGITGAVSGAPQLTPATQNATEPNVSRPATPGTMPVVTEQPKAAELKTHVQQP